MNRNGGLIAAFLALVTFFGVSNFSRTSEGPATARPKQSAFPAGAAAAVSLEPYSPCLEIASRLRRLTNEAGGAPIKTWRLPDSCYQGDRPSSGARTVGTPPEVRFVVATVPNPVATHLPLFFDRMVESIQQAAQDDLYSYDASWFPWDADPKDYSSLADQQAEEERRKINERQPGVIVFRRSKKDVDPYSAGLVVFLVGEQPTGGVKDGQFENAIEWISRLGGFSGTPALRILGPTFSGSIPSLQRDLEPLLKRLGGALKLEVSSGTVSSFYSYQRFENWIASLKNGSSFETATESDSLMVDRFCRYLDAQGYARDRVTLLSEDETAFGGRGDEPVCPQAVRLYYPRDIATLRSAYESQSILTPPKPQSPTGAPSTTLRGDLSEPSTGDHDTVHLFGGQLSPLAQESILLDIVNRLEEKRIEFIILRSTSSLDQIFLSEFLHRAYPGGRVVIDGADLLFNRGAEGRSLRGVMLLSTYPLLTSEQEWTASLLQPRNAGYRTFGEDTAEAEYIAARDLFGDGGTGVPIHDYSPPAWAVTAQNREAGNQRPVTWISVVGRRQFWPLAALESSPKGGPVSILEASSVRGDQPVHDDGVRSPLRLPTTMWMTVMACLIWSLVHACFCMYGAIMGSPRGRAYFAPLPLWQHPALIALGSLLVAMIAVIVAACTGLFPGSPAGDPFQEPAARVVLAISVLSCLALSVLACYSNYNLPVLRVTTSKGDHSKRWRLFAALTAVLCFAILASIYFVLVSLLTPENALPVYVRSVNLSSGVSPLLPQLLLLAGGYLWFWCNLRGLAHFGEDRPSLPTEADLPKDGETPMMPMFSQEKAGTPVEDAARPLSRDYLARLSVIFAITVVISRVALQDFSLRTLGERAFGRLIFIWVCLYIAVILADSMEVWRAWSKHRRLLIYLDRLPVRRTFSALKGLEWGSVWKMSGDVLEERYRVISFQFESIRHLSNATAQWEPKTAAEEYGKAELRAKLKQCRAKADEFAHWFVTFQKKGAVELEKLRDFQDEIASTAGMVMKNVLIPAWQQETRSLIFDRSMPEEKESTSEIPVHVQAAEEFFVLPYLAFIQNILGRIRTIALGSLWLFVGATLAVSSYPFDPLNVLGGIFLLVFVIYGGLSALVYSQMSRDATLSHITNTPPGALGWDFWGRLITFGAGPLIGLLTTLFPSITDFVFSWLQPSTQALK